MVWPTAIPTRCPAGSSSRGRWPRASSPPPRLPPAPRPLAPPPAPPLPDEPLATLDRELRSEMEVEIRRYQKELQIPFVYVTHNQEEALTMSDRIAVMRSGVFEQGGLRNDVYRKPATAL